MCINDNFIACASVADALTLAKLVGRPAITDGYWVGVANADADWHLLTAMDYRVIS